MRSKLSTLCEALGLTAIVVGTTGGLAQVDPWLGAGAGGVVLFGVSVLIGLAGDVEPEHAEPEVSE